MNGNNFILDAEHQRRYLEAIKRAKMEGDDQFMSWFNKSKDIKQSIIRGYWDLMFHILTPKVCAYIKNPEEKTVLEIGYGGGRILNAACSYFKYAIGIDIHNEQKTVESFLKSQCKYNFRLTKTSGRTIDVDSESIDFIYSFIVLQHLPSFEVFESYIEESYSCLKVGGLAQLYFGKYSKLNPIDQFHYFIRGYKEIADAKVNYTSLVIRMSTVKKLCRDIGFKVIDTGTSYKNIPDGYPKIRGGQNYVTLLKRSDK